MAVAWPATLAAASVEQTVTMPPPQAQQRILQAVREIVPQREERQRYRLSVPLGARLFPFDAELAAPPLLLLFAIRLAYPTDRTGTTR